MSFLIKALERAKNNGKDNSTIVNINKEALFKAKSENRPQKTSKERYINVDYTQTSIQPNDPERLKENSIFALFDEIDATNQIKILRTQVIKKLKALKGNSILVTSANSREGKTFTSINLGVSIAKEFDKTVLIVDADLRKPKDNHYSFTKDFFCLEVKNGLSEYLQGKVDIKDILINPGIEKIAIIPSGKPSANASELLNSESMEKMMREIKSRYPDRFVIIDTPPVLEYTDAIILSRYVDGVLIVVESEKTSAEDLKKLVNNLKDTVIIGTILNKTKG